MSSSGFALLNIDSVESLEEALNRAFNAGKLSPNEVLAMVQKAVSRIEVAKAAQAPAWPADLAPTATDWRVQCRQASRHGH